MSRTPPETLDGRAYWEWIMSQPDARGVKSRALAAAHKLGYSPRIWAWSPAQVESVRGRLAQAPPDWGGSR